MLAERCAARLLNMQKNHHIVCVHIELEVLVHYVLVTETRIGWLQLLSTLVVMVSRGEFSRSTS